MAWNEGMVGGSNSLGVGSSTSVDESKETLLLFFDAREAVWQTTSNRRMSRFSDKHIEDNVPCQMETSHFHNRS